MHSALQPLIDTPPIALGDRDYPAKLEALRQVMITTLDNSLTDADSKVALAYGWATSMSPVSGGQYGAAYYAVSASGYATTAQGWATTAQGWANAASGSVTACQALIDSLAGGPVLKVNGKSGPYPVLTAADVGAVASVDGQTGALNSLNSAVLHFLLNQ